ncbi:COX15/CtaA family protein [Candidatus Pelagibacter bacterium nBUS_36]|uniref:COX15/CtaA family protein n=1 Tax=Candidatus Pelagibacter bacterium nBUS_36 TaxID=3374194 RepID=UPI003EBBA635|tara:strand:- start:889 stop:1914 length:1026 start_codon:yes stop_codon:yes gene_type:complete
MYSLNNSLNHQLKIWLIILLLLITLIILVGGLTRLTDSGLSITTWELFVGFLPPLTDEKWITYFNLYKTIPEYSEQNSDMTLNQFKVIFWWEWFHRQLGRLVGLSVLLPLIYFTIKHGFWVLKKYGIIFFLVCLQGFFGWYMVSSGLVNRVDVSHYRLSIHLVTAFIILSIVFWNFLQLTNLKINQISIKIYSIKLFLFLLFLQLIIGAFVSGMDAGMIYNTWPLMGSSYFPDDTNLIELLNVTLFDNPSIVQFIHRNLAYLIVLIYIYLLILVFMDRNKIFRKPILVIGICLLLQVILGILTILSGVKIIYASLHQINSVLIIFSTLYFLYISKYKEKIN